MIKPYEFIFNNKLKLVYVPIQGFDSFTINIRGNVGSYFESKNQIGSSHLLEHMLVRNIQKNLNKKQIPYNIVGITSRDDILISTKTLGKYLEDTLKIILDSTFNLDVNRQNIRLHKNIILKEIQRIEENPEKIISRMCHLALFRYWRSKIPNVGTEKSLTNLKRSDLFEFYNNNFVPSKFIITIVGDSDIKYLKYSISSYFKRKRVLKNIHKTIPHTINKPYLYNTNNEKIKYISLDNIKQLHIRFDNRAYKITSKKRIFHELYAFILNKLLVDKIKHSDGDSYSVQTNYNGSYLYGTISTVVSTTLDSLSKTILTYHTVNRIIQKLSVTDLTTYHQLFVNEFKIKLDKPTAYAEFYSKNLNNMSYKKLHVDFLNYLDINPPKKVYLSLLKKEITKSALPEPNITIVYPKKLDIVKNPVLNFKNCIPKDF